MKRYRPATHRTLGIAAATLMTVATLAVAVIAPAGADEVSDAIAPRAETAAVSGDTCVTTRIDVIAVRVPPARRAAAGNGERVDS